MNIIDFMSSRETTCRPKTQDLYQHVLSKFKEWLNGRSLNAETINEYLRSLKRRGLAEETVRNNYRVLKTYCRWLVNYERLEHDPFTGRNRVITPSIRRRRRKTYSEADIIKLLSARPPESANKRKMHLNRRRWAPDGPLAREEAQGRALVLLLADSGMRAGEAASLTCGQIRATDELVIVSKGGHEDVAFISTATRAILLSLAGQRADSDPLFRDWDGNPATPVTLRGLLRRLAKRAGVQLPARPLHSFRHYAARSWVKSGVNDLTIQQFMRHANLATTQIYTRLDPHELSKIHESASQVARLLEASKGTSVG